MKYVKMLGLLAVAAAALMAFVGTASATVTYNGSAYTGTISASSDHTELDGTVDVTCEHSTVAGSITNGATTADLTTLTFENCRNDTVTVIKKGSLRVETHPTEPEAKATVYSEGAEVTVQVHRVVLGFPVTTHCLYRTKTAGEGGTDVGDLTQGTDVIHLIGTDIPRGPTDSGCGENSQWTGEYTITSPGALTVH